VLTKGSTLTSVRYMLWFKGLISNKQTNKQTNRYHFSVVSSVNVNCLPLKFC